MLLRMMSKTKGALDASKYFLDRDYLTRKECDVNKNWGSSWNGSRNDVEEEASLTTPEYVRL